LFSLKTGTVAENYSYCYDAMRRRVLDNDTWYIYDGWRVIEERKGAFRKSGEKV
jgi:hypothetical protein